MSSRHLDRVRRQVAHLVAIELHEHPVRALLGWYATLELEPRAEMAALGTVCRCR
jgi:hypothetical protein